MNSLWTIQEKFVCSPSPKWKKKNWCEREILSWKLHLPQIETISFQHRVFIFMAKGPLKNLIVHLHRWKPFPGGSFSSEIPLIQMCVCVCNYNYKLYFAILQQDSLVKLERAETTHKEVFSFVVTILFHSLSYFVLRVIINALHLFKTDPVSQVLDIMKYSFMWLFL